MASPGNIQMSLDSDKRQIIIVPCTTSEEVVDRNVGSRSDSEQYFSNGEDKKTDKSSEKKTYTVKDKISTSWVSPESENLERRSRTVNTSSGTESVFVNGVNQVETDSCRQNASNHPVLVNAETWSVGNESQFLGATSTHYQPHTSYNGANSGGNFHHSVPKVNYSHRGPSPTSRRYNSSHSCGTSPNHQVTGSSSSNSVNISGNGQHIVLLHVNPGETISFHMGDHMQLIQGPATVRMVSSNSTPPIPMPVQVPPGHIVQQIVDENGTLRHIILSPQPPVAVPMGNPYNQGPTPGTAQAAGPSPFFVYPHPSYPPPTQFHPHMQPGLTGQGLHGHGHPQSQQCNSHSSHQGSSATASTSHSHAHKDERTHRQVLRLKKRLEVRQKDSIAIPPEPSPSSPRKDGTEKKIKEKSPPSEEVSGDKSVNEDNSDARLIIELLSSIKAPMVSAVTARSALVSWLPPQLKVENKEKYKDELQETDFSYKLLLSEKGRDIKQKVVYSGNLLEYNISDLKPASVNYVCIQAVLDEILGNPSESVSIKMLSCEPDVPQPPKLMTRTKTSIVLKWNATPDNGSKVISYILEYDEGQGDEHFVELFNGLQKQYKVTKLNASTCYRFRLAAVNEHGKSQYSEIGCFSTSGSTPSQPLPPLLKQTFVNKLSLQWQARPNDDDFTLQMEDEATRHGFLPVYNGRDTSYTCTNLRRNTEYKFRLSANNEEGSSPWSKTVSFITLPDKPVAPGKPFLKGRVHSTSFKVAWESPRDTGGSPITGYNLEMSSDNGFEPLYSGPEVEYQCEQLKPGTTYSFRVQCTSAGGSSPHSEIGTITTLPVVPGKCQPPRLLGKPKALSMHLKWSYPEYDGGAEISEFEIEMTNPDSSTRQAYKGQAADCVVAGLQPGRPYLFHVRAYNKVGYGSWSDPLEVITGAGTPDMPKEVQATPRSPHSVVVTWEEPFNNGAVITDYHVESSQSEEGYEVVYMGLQVNAEIKSLVPATLYFFRVQAINSAGAGPFSDVVSCQTPPSSPGSISVSNIKAICGATTVALSWKEPNSHGATISSYNIEVGENLFTTDGDQPQICIEGLMPETTYKVRVQAINAVGLGPFSSSLKVTTRGLPPSPPTLECCGYGHNTLRLKWGDGKNPELIQYILEAENAKTGSFIPVYQGTGHCHKITKLQEMTSYSFRIYASNDEGDGPYSDVFTFTTLKALPPALKAPKICSVTETNCVVEWQPAKTVGEDALSYRLQLGSRDSDYHVVYTGIQTSFVISGLQPNTEYSTRVAALRHCTDGSGELPGAYSPSSVFSTTQQVSTRNTAPKMVSAMASLADRQPLTDQQWAIIILCGFTLFAILVAILIERILSYSRS